MTTFATSVRLGTSYMTLRSTSSRIARSPRAPVPRRSACSAISSRAAGSNSSSTLSRSNSRWYCFVRALRGSVSTDTSASRSSFATAVKTGRRPTNSGIMPNFRRSSGSARLKTSAGSLLSSVTRSPSTRSKVNPSCFLPIRCSMMRSRPANAPPTMNSTFVVSIWMNS